MNFTDSIKKAIRDCGMTLTAIGRDAGVKRQSLERFMAGTQSLRLDMADRLGAFFGIDCRIEKRGKAKKGKA